MTNSIPFPPNARVVAYLRDSGGSEQDLSVAQQREVITQWCQEHDLLLTRVFADVAAPGSSVVGREAFQDMIRHFHNPEHTESAVILWKYSRFSRDLDDAQFFKADLRRRGVIIHSINDNIPDTIDGRIYESLIDWMNARFLEDLSTDVKRGLQHLLQTYGGLPGIPPRGFKRDPVVIGTRRDGSQHTVGRWVPDPELWEICRHAWKLRAGGTAIKRIHEETHLYNNRSSYNDFFRNRLYLGELNYGETVIQNYVEPLVDQSTWDAVQRLNRSNSDENDPMRGQRHPRRVASSYLLSGLLYCLKCGALMNGKTVTFRGKTKMRYYQCTTSHARMNCDARRVPAAAIESLVEKHLMESILDPAVILERDRELSLARENSLAEFKAERKRLTIQLNDARKRIRNLVDRISGEDSPPRSLISGLKDFERSELELTDRLARLRSMENQELVFLTGQDEAAELVARFHELWDSQDLEYQRSILRGLVRKISCQREGNKIEGMIHFYNPNASDLKQKPPSGGDEGLPTGRCLHGAPSFRQTYVVKIESLIKNKQVLKYNHSSYRNTQD